jgi:HD-like signal output (HDOD) protein
VSKTTIRPDVIDDTVVSEPMVGEPVVSDTPARENDMPTPVSSDAVRDLLRRELSDAVRRLDEVIPKDERTPDFMTLVGQLAGDPEGRIRRPPAAAQRAMSACHNEKVSSEALVALLEEDPMLTQAVLARANSAYYNRSGRPCLVLAEAITRQGRRSVHNVLLQQTLGSLVYSPGGAWHEMVNKVWSHMVRSGPIARSLAPLFDVDPEQAFALALLHDVGKLAVFDRVATLRTALRHELHIPKPALTRALRELHEPLGGLCALGWGLGDEAALAIATHHREPVPAIHNAASEVIWLAERVDLAVQRGEQMDLPALWRIGALSANLEVARGVIAGLMPRPEEELV